MKTTPVEIEVLPDKEGAPGRLRAFGRWLSRVLGLTSDEPADEIAHELNRLLTVAKDSQTEKLLAEGIRNRRLRADIEKQLADAAKTEHERVRSEALFDDERELLRAQAAKTMAEADAIASERRLREITTLRNIGVEVTPLVDARGDLVGVRLRGVERVVREGAADGAKVHASEAHERATLEKLPASDEPPAALAPLKPEER